MEDWQVAGSASSRFGSAQVSGHPTHSVPFKYVFDVHVRQVVASAHVEHVDGHGSQSGPPYPSLQFVHPTPEINTLHE